MKTNFYQITQEKYMQLLHNSISKAYKKANLNITSNSKKQSKKCP